MRMVHAIFRVTNMPCRESYIKEYEPADTHLYYCPVCQHEQDVAVKYDGTDRRMYPVDYRDTICPKCYTTMDEKRTGG